MNHFSENKLRVNNIISYPINSHLSTYVINLQVVKMENKMYIQFKLGYVSSD